jgi:methyl-accepting chemotaxis protein
MKREKDTVAVVLGKVQETQGSIQGIVTYVEKVADMVQRIAVATEEQSSTSDMVSHSMEDAAVITRQLSSSILEIKRAAGDLSRLAAELNTMAGWFKT